jgi:DNA-binding NarL/FixJ family response regulator
MIRRDLSDRKLQILELIGKGLANKQIADKMFLSEKTVKNHIGKIFTKLHVPNRVSAVITALKQGLIEL